MVHHKAISCLNALPSNSFKAPRNSLGSSGKAVTKKPASSQLARGVPIKQRQIKPNHDTESEDETKVVTKAKKEDLAGTSTTTTSVKAKLEKKTKNTRLLKKPINNKRKKPAEAEEGEVVDEEDDESGATTRTVSSFGSSSSSTNSNDDDEEEDNTMATIDALPRLTRSQHRLILGDTPPGAQLQTATANPPSVPFTSHTAVAPVQMEVEEQEVAAASVVVEKDTDMSALIDSSDTKVPANNQVNDLPPISPAAPNPPIPPLSPTCTSPAPPLLSSPAAPSGPCSSSLPPLVPSATSPGCLSDASTVAMTGGDSFIQHLLHPSPFSSASASQSSDVDGPATTATTATIFGSAHQIFSPQFEGRGAIAEEAEDGESSRSDGDSSLSSSGPIQEEEAPTQPLTPTSAAATTQRGRASTPRGGRRGAGGAGVRPGRNRASTSNVDAGNEETESTQSLPASSSVTGTAVRQQRIGRMVFF